MNIAVPKTYSSIKNKRGSKKAGVILYKIQDGKIYIFLVQGNNCNVTFTDGDKKFSKGKVGIPKGFIEDKETPERCARREFNEETGMLVGPLTRLTKYVFISTSYIGEFRECDEVCSYMWVHIDEVKRYNINRFTKNALNLMKNEYSLNFK